MIIICNKDLENAILYGKRIYCRRILNASNVIQTEGKAVAIITNEHVVKLIKEPIDASIGFDSLKKAFKNNRRKK